ncbi:MAG: DUF2813 domain-containing protein [candidate division Zixibacteria bacterium]
MRIDAIELIWFRGAADLARLDLRKKSMVIYGENASGKSSFVDAIEYVLNDGRIGHLVHEYSGKRQEKGILNTHIPDAKQTEFRIKFADGSLLTTNIERNGKSSVNSTGTVSMGDWDYRRTVLRQDEVAEFIRCRKGEKYSALLPLLGLDQLEMVAENLRQLGKSVTQESKLVEMKTKLNLIENRRSEAFGTYNNYKLEEKIEALHKKYRAAHTTMKMPLDRCRDLESFLSSRVKQFSKEQKKYTIFRDIADTNLIGYIKTIRSHNNELTGSVESLISEKLEVIEQTSTFLDKLEDEKEIPCPACGRVIPVRDLEEHIESEKERFEEMIATFRKRKTSINTLCDKINLIKSSLAKTEIKEWSDLQIKGPLKEKLSFLDELNIEKLRSSLVEDDLKIIEEKLQPIIDETDLISKDAPSEIDELLADKKIVEVCKEIIDSKGLVLEKQNAEALISFIQSMENGIRNEIRVQSQKIIDEISIDIEAMWDILHPGELVEGIRLYVPEESDKAIDVKLKFHGVDQDSPRLTLSESYRNSLGLCIFLAMAKREASSDRPLFLDDVVVSLDRNHRGMIVELLEKKFDDRQLIIFTHDREWYTELRHLLDATNWSFKVLMPWESPKIGIRFSEKSSTFDDARALLNKSPDSAGNTARKIMDIELPLRAERLKLLMPYQHREKNDHRMAHDFLQRLISDGQKCFMKKVDGNHCPFEDAIEAFREAGRLILAWGNRASHTFDVKRNEAIKLIDVCEEALGFFECENCRKPVHKLEDKSAELVQCQCGKLRWRYGKI